MVSTEQAQQLLNGGVVTGSDGDSIGKVGEVYFDNETGEPNWVTVRTGWFSTSESFVPLAQATIVGDDVRVLLDKDTIKGAPNKAAGVPLSEQDEDELYRYYGLSGDSAPVIGNSSVADSADTAGLDERRDASDAAACRTARQTRPVGPRATASTSPGRRSS